MTPIDGISQPDVSGRENWDHGASVQHGEYSLQVLWAQTFTPGALDGGIPSSSYYEKNPWEREPPGGGHQSRYLCPLSICPGELGR